MPTATGKIAYCKAEPPITCLNACLNGLASPSYLLQASGSLNSAFPCGPGANCNNALGTFRLTPDVSDCTWFTNGYFGPCEVEVHSFQWSMSLLYFPSGPERVIINVSYQCTFCTQTSQAAWQRIYTGSEIPLDCQNLQAEPIPFVNESFPAYCTDFSSIANVYLTSQSVGATPPAAAFVAATPPPELDDFFND